MKFGIFLHFWFLALVEEEFSNFSRLLHVGLFHIYFYNGMFSFFSTDDKMVCLDPHYCQSAVDMSRDDFPTEVNIYL